ncbi:DUF2147 domain-containing protein [Bradyrhizobium erythrophlei]|uniref:Uncharacterized conserved protein, DUF2147 family n=1 Tax=Bradyrhizobium erythrophlei TaxID=1437360 RepID=A0A1H4UHX0_9BRAD|nr:DUF2147 domain-containing protein [Bradyrhizobium erythrophlei]SEC68376.1 Uncharacterized conserved protein, DUF2147 family [Bradyrhizobium erythrophlei]
MKAVRLCQSAVVLVLSATPSLADGISGVWLRNDGEVRVKFDQCGDAICGAIVWLKPGAESKAKIGQRVFYEMRSAGANSWTGKASPDGDSVYSGKLSIEGATLTTSGCIVGGLICKSASWTRVP